MNQVPRSMHPIVLATAAVALVLSASRQANAASPGPYRPLARFLGLYDVDGCGTCGPAGGRFPWPGFHHHHQWEEAPGWNGFSPPPGEAYHPPLPPDAPPLESPWKPIDPRGRPAGQPAEVPPTDQPPLDSAPLTDQFIPSTTSQASLGAGAQTPMLGRGDSSNRRNLFDTMSAIPTNRMWFGYQRLWNFNSGLAFTSDFMSTFETVNALPPGSFDPTDPAVDSAVMSTLGVGADIITPHDETLYRYGIELALTRTFSVAILGQYHNAFGIDVSPDDFESPQVILKWMMAAGPHGATSFVLGIDPEIGHDQVGVISDRTTRLSPGILGYHEHGRWFKQWGVQLSLPTEGNQPYATDWAVSLGWWLYRHPSLGGGSHDIGSCGCDVDEGCPCGGRYGGGCGGRFGQRCGGCGPCGDHCGGWVPWIVGIAPQVEFLGHHLAGDTTITNPFGFSTVSAGPFSGVDVLVYEEPRSVVDLTVGGTILFRNNTQIGIAGSIPLTRQEVRTAELLITATLGF